MSARQQQVQLFGEPETGAQPQERFHHHIADGQSKIFAPGYLLLSRRTGQSGIDGKTVDWLYQL